MPSQKPRIALTVPDDLNELLDSLSKLTGEPKSTMITGFLVDMQPVLQEMENALIQAKQLKDSMPSLARLTALANSHTAVMNNEMSDLMSQIDWVDDK